MKVLTTLCLSVLGLMFLGSFPFAFGQGLSATFEEKSEPLVVSGQVPRSLVKRDGSWSISLWVKPTSIPELPANYHPGYPKGESHNAPQFMLIGGVGSGENTQGTQRMFLASITGLSLWDGQDTIYSHTPLRAGEWQFLAATFDGEKVRIYQDGKLSASGVFWFREAASVITLAPALVWNNLQRFEGSIADFTVSDQLLPPEKIARLAQSAPNSATLPPLQPSLAAAPTPYRMLNGPGLFESQDPRTQPVSQSSPSRAVRKAKLTQQKEPVAGSDGRMVLNTGWELIEERRTSLDGAKLSKPGVDTKTWYDATVPGTVLTTLVDQGIYPDPYYGLNNLSIPESLSRQDWWYRTEFATPASFRDKTFSLDFLGVNYNAEIWLNGSRVGTLKGIGLRGKYDVSKLLAQEGGRNALAVKITPPPHVGHPVELSLGIYNRPCGGWLVLDGPTFFATKNWDWIPGIRDRSIGLWQDVVLAASGAVTIADPFVKPTFPKPDFSASDLSVSASLTNHTSAEQRVTLRGTMEDRSFEQTVTVPASGTVPVVS